MVQQPIPHDSAAVQGSSAAVPRPNPAPVPTMSYTPTDTTIPPSLYSKIPNLDLYKKLQDSERKIDLLITRKSLDLQALQGKTTHPSSYQKHTGTLRVFVYNTCENQPWQVSQEGGNLIDPNVESTWTLRIEGRFLGDDDAETDGNSVGYQSFSSLLSGISVDIIQPAQQQHHSPPQFQAPQEAQRSNIIEWRNPIEQQLAEGKQPGGPPPPSVGAEFDGLDIKRPGIYNLQCKIAILPRAQPSILKLSDPMSQFIGKQESSQQELVFLVWQYVLYKDLLKNVDSFTKVPAVSVVGVNANASSATGNGNGDDGDDLKVVECDETLQRLFNVPTFRFSDLFKLIQPHFQPREPIILNYEIDTTRSTTLGDLIIDIPVDLPATLSEFQQGVIESSKQIVESLSQSDALIQQLNSKISLGVVALQNSNSREIFYRELSEDPVKFMENWLQSQSETLKVLKSDEGYDEEVVRRSEYYEKNEDLLRDNINILLGAGKI
ncbi:transcription regulatory protein Snf12p [[Candida] railenensis]|uniref:Transcription regulatory protein Snf12p n=1 Tax=[Candida] railenensis TaxID=45579 RepID=A0A9P0VWZ2_9ASCO|nr:transcription regulatory protein Snf12p [[Candida] railenensis]